MSSLVPFLGLAIVLVAIPGPAVTLIMKNAVMRGGRAAFVTALGVLVADMVWVVASVVGLTALLVASEPAFLAVKLFGAVYLIWLGALLLIGRHEQASPTVTPAGGVAPRGTGRAFREGVICDLSNPKTLLVFTSVIPQFLPAGHHVGQAAVLGVAFALVGFASLAVYAFAFSRARRAVVRPRLKRALLRGSGGILVAFGIGVAGEAAA